MKPDKKITWLKPLSAQEGYTGINRMFFMAGVFFCFFAAADFPSGYARNLLLNRRNKMEYGLIGAFIKFAFAKTSFTYIEKEIPEMNMSDYKKRALKEYRAIAERTPGIGSMKDNMFVMTMYAGAFMIALYKQADGKLDEEKLKGLIRAAAFCPLMVKAKQGKSAFAKKEIASRIKQAKWSRDHIEEYPMNWFYYFETVPGKEEYYITHKQCGICKLTKQEHCEGITKYLCMMDCYTFEMQGAVLDRTKTLGYGDDACNFHLMSKARAGELGFVPSPDAK